jgi:hypothetical protein
MTRAEPTNKMTNEISRIRMEPESFVILTSTGRILSASEDGRVWRIGQMMIGLG